MKKIIAVVFSLVLILGIFPASVFATENNGFEDYEQHIYDALINCEETIDLAEYNVPLQNVMNFVNEILYCYPEIACNIAIVTDEQGDTSYDIQLYRYSNGNAAYIEMGYSMVKDEYNEAIKRVDETISPIINKVKMLSDFEKALYIHDWICVNFMYDYRLFEGGNENHDIIGFFADKMGVCQSYAYTYMYMLRKVGIESQFVESITDNHGWNIVKIDDNWYHVDVTHDDPIIGKTYYYDYLGEVRHSNFLLSDSQIIADGEHDDFYIPFFKEIGMNVTCGEYTGNDSWRTAGSAVLKIKDYWYYLDSSADAGGLMKTKDFSTVELVMEIGYHYVNEEQGIDTYGWRIGNKFYGGYYSGLFEYNEHLFFTDADDIYVYDTHHKKVNKLPVERPENLHYFGLNMEGKTLKYLTSDSNIKENVIYGDYTLLPGIHILTDWEVLTEATQTEVGEKVKYCYFCGEIVERQSIPALNDVVSGDADGDGMVDSRDLAMEKLILAGSYSGVVCRGADCNFDGKVDTTDLSLIKLKLAGVN